MTWFGIRALMSVLVVTTYAKEVMFSSTSVSYYAPPLIGEGIKQCFYLTSACLSVTYIGPKSRTETPRKTKIGTRDSDTTFKVKRSRSPGRFTQCGLNA